MKSIIIGCLSSIVLLVGILAYTLIGTSGNVAEIRKLAPTKIKESGWRILRGEGYQYGAWGEHGGKVWYHVQDTLNPNIQYRVYYTLWDGELQAYYGEPEQLTRVQVDLK